MKERSAMKMRNPGRTGFVWLPRWGRKVGGLNAVAVMNSFTSAEELGRCRVERVETIAETRWLRLQKLTYRDAEGSQRLWDAVARTTKREEVTGDGVAVFARLRAQGKEDETILIRQFRPPVNRVTVEFPAGLIDEGESPVQAALRELKEETGFTGHAQHVTAWTCTSPGLCGETLSVVTVLVDLDDDANRAVTPKLEDGEQIAMERVPIRRLLHRLEELSAEGCLVFTGLLALATGIHLGAEMK